MDFNVTVKCFRFVFTFLIFVFPKTSLTRMMCIQILQKPLEQCHNLGCEKIYFPNDMKLAKLNLVNKFVLRTFDNVDDRYYKNNRNMVEKMKGTFVDGTQQTKRKKAGNEETPSFSEQKGRIYGTYQVNVLNEGQLRNVFSIQDHVFSSKSSYQNLREKMDKIKKLKKLSPFKPYRRTNPKFENYFLELIEKLLEGLNRKLEERLKKTTSNNKFQIDSIFFIKKLLVENSRKEPYVRLVALSVKEIFNNFKVLPVHDNGPMDAPVISNSDVKPDEMDLIGKLQKNFSKIFHNQDVTLEQINQMSKIVNFVERYHGIVSDLKNLDLSEEGVFKRLKNKMS